MLPCHSRRSLPQAKAGGRPSTSLLPAQREDVDADPSLRLGQALLRHDNVEVTAAPRGALISRRILTAHPLPYQEIGEGDMAPCTAFVTGNAASI
jgi:hypothetical protein